MQALDKSLSSLNANMQLEDLRLEVRRKANLEDMLKLLDPMASRQ